MPDIASFDINIMDFNALDKLIDYIDDMPRNIERALDDAMYEIADKVKVRMLYELAKYGLADSSLATSIIVNADTDGLSIIVDSDHAWYVEFGTGVVGASVPHERPSFFGQSFSYASGPQSSKGRWWYEIDKGYADSHGITTSQGKDGNYYAMTKGMISRPFIYNSYLYARRIVTRTVNKHLKRVL